MNPNSLSIESQQIDSVLNSPSFLIDEPEFQRAITAHAILELYSRLGLPDRCLPVFLGLLSYTRGSTEPQRVPQGAIAGTAWNLVGATDAQKKYALQRVGRYLTVIRERQKIVVVQVEPGGLVGRNKVWTVLTVLAWMIIHNAIEYLPVEMPDVPAQFKGMKGAMDRAVDEYEKGSSRLVGHLGKKRMPLSSEQKVRSLFTQYQKIIEAEHLKSGAYEARRLQAIGWRELEEVENDLRAWEGRKKHEFK